MTSEHRFVATVQLIRAGTFAGANQMALSIDVSD